MSSNEEPRGGERESLPVLKSHDETTENGSGLTRRRFLGGIASVAAMAAAGVVPALVTSAALAPAAQANTAAAGEGEAESAASYFASIDQPVNYPGKPVWYAPEPGEQKFAMVIDVNACIGCRRCVYACIKENNVGRTLGSGYIELHEMEPGTWELESSDIFYEKGGRPDRWYLPIQCMHCAKPTCVYGCPVQATWKEPDGIVTIDYNKCICCKNCLVTCPYGARHVNWIYPEIPEGEVNPEVPVKEKYGVVEKCTFCVHRTRNGKTTACVEACPVGARKFGDLNDPKSEVSVLLETKTVFRLKEELGNEPMIWYVG